MLLALLTVLTKILLLGVAAFVLVGAKREEVIVMRKLIGRHWICNQGKIIAKPWSQTPSPKTAQGQTPTKSSAWVYQLPVPV